MASHTSGSMKLWFAIAALGWWTVLVGSTSDQVQPLGGVGSSASSSDDHRKPLLYIKLTLKVTDDDIATEEAYRTFIFQLRDQLGSGDFSNDIPLLRSPAQTPVSHQGRFVLVELQYSGLAVTLGVDVTNAYVVAYQTGDRSYFFRDAPAGAGSYLFTNTNQQTLSYGGSYSDLERQAGRGRGGITLGSGALRDAIRSLRAGGSDVARSLIVAIETISEAARFREIEREIRRHMRLGEAFYPDEYTLGLETSWSRQSRAVQNSNQGVFPNQITLTTQAGPVILDNVLRVIANLALLLYDCKKPKGHPQFPSSQPLIIRRGRRSSSSEQAKAILISSDGDVGDADGVCEIPEPRVHLFGRNNSFIPAAKNDLWTVKRDGTIRDDENECLTATGDVSGSTVNIQNCAGAGAAARWEIWKNGSIINSRSGLAMSIMSVPGGTKAAVEHNNYASRQGWFLTNDTRLSFVFIVGPQNLCMQADRNASAVRLYKCANNSRTQKWGLFYDGSIRPQRYRGQCLTCENDFVGTVISLLSCSNGSPGQRWFFTNEGTILNLGNGLVMEADPRSRQIDLKIPGVQKPNQEWFSTASIK